MNSKYWMTVAMRTFGGSFVQALGECILRADDDNYNRIVTAFPEYIERYQAIGDKLKQEDDAKR